MFTVIYDDPKRRRGAAHTVHVDGCRDVARAVARGGNPQPLRAVTLDDALHEAQYQGCGEGGDLGDVDPAPCTKAVRRQRIS